MGSSESIGGGREGSMKRENELNGDCGISIGGRVGMEGRRRFVVDGPAGG